MRRELSDKIDKIGTMFQISSEEVQQVFDSAAQTHKVSTKVVEAALNKHMENHLKLLVRTAPHEADSMRAHDLRMHRKDPLTYKADFMIGMAKNPEVIDRVVSNYKEELKEKFTTQRSSPAAGVNQQDSGYAR